MYNFLIPMASPRSLLAAILTFCASGMASAAMIVTNNGIPVDLPGISTFITHGDDMDGLEITATFADDTGATFTEMAVMAGTTPDDGTAIGTDWSVDVSGDTFFDLAWTFNNNRSDILVSLEFFGAPGLTVFDLATPDIGPPTSTANTAQGKGFITDLDPLIDGLITALYTDIVGVAGNPAVGDIYERVQVSFLGANGLILDNGVGFAFTMDTDSDVRRFEVPAPGTLLLLSGALLLGGARRDARRDR